MYAMYVGIFNDGAKDNLDDHYDRPFDLFKKYYEMPSLYRTPGEWLPLLGESKQMDWGSYLYVCSRETVQKLFKIKKTGIAPVFEDRIGSTRSSTTLPKAEWYGIMEVESY